MKYLIIIFTLSAFNVFASSPKEWQKFYEGIESECNSKILQYFPSEKFSKIGKMETSIQDGNLIVFLLFQTKEGTNAGCIYNQKTGAVEVDLLNQIL